MMAKTKKIQRWRKRNYTRKRKIEKIEKRRVIRGWERIREPAGRRRERESSERRRRRNRLEEQKGGGLDGKC